MPSFEISPFKELLLQKKPDVAQLKGILEDMSAEMRTKWLNCTLDATPPPMPAPLFHAVAAAQWEVVELLVEFKVDVLAQYEGKSLLKGWIRPNTPLVECVQGRKGRFVGTMLGDKLEACEALLIRAAKRQQREAAGEDDAKNEGDTSSMRYFRAGIRATSWVARQRTKSVQLKSIRGLMLHTQGHPTMRYELDESFNGQGSSCVMAAIQTETGKPYAIKAGSKCADDGRVDAEAQLWNEIVILRKLEHPNIIRLHETFEDDSNIFMVFELCRGGELFDHLVRNGSLAEKTAMRLAYQMAAAIGHLHQLRICHRDIRPEAFIVAEDAPLEVTSVKLMDLNNAKDLGSGPMTTKIATLHYVAPEVLTSSDAGYTEKIDIWSFGVVIYIMAAGAPPFDAENELDILQAVKEGVVDFEPAAVWAELSADLKDLVSRLLTKDPEQRPSMASVLEHSRLKLAETEGALICPEPGGAASSGAAVGEASQLRTAFTSLVENIDDARIPELRKFFKSVDYAQTGVVNITDCRQGLAQMFQGNEELKDLVQKIESNALTGKINYAMFLAMMTDKRRTIRREAARAIFNAFDIDKNGNISVYEIAQAMGRGDDLKEGCSPNVPLRELRAIWEEMKDVFSSQEFSDRELTFEDFFNQLPKANLGATV